MSAYAPAMERTQDKGIKRQPKRRRPGTWATIVGTVFAHRLFDVVAATGLVVYVLYTSRIPQWAKPAWCPRRERAVRGPAWLLRSRSGMTSPPPST